MLNRRDLAAAVLVVGFVLSTTAAAGIFKSRDEQRAQIDADQKTTLTRLFKESKQAQRLYDSAYGYATFSIIKVSLGLTGGGGQGVAINKATGERIYMRMGTGGFNFGAGGQLYQLVFLFEDQDSFDNFVNNGWEAGASANAVAGTLGANAGTTFINGVAVYQLTEAGLMLQVDISGTNYWKSKLNRR
jgi:lipid-binding SYLF domain-containing protein